MQLDDKTANAVTTRPTAEAAGALRWFRKRDLGGGITGTTMEQDFLNDQLGNFIALFFAASITRTKGVSGDSDLLNAIESIVAQGAGRSTLIGHLKRTAPGIIQLQPLVGTKVSVGIDNTILYETGAISFDMASDLEGSEAASTALYLYLRNQAGGLDPQISATAPYLPGGTKPGYKSGDATRRCVGSTWNNIAQDFVECTWLPGGEVLFHSHDGDHEHALALTGAGWQLQAVKLPLCATAFRLLHHFSGDDDAIALAASDAATNPTVPDKILGTNAGEILFEMSEDNSSTRPLQTIEGLMPVADMAAPGFRWTTYGATLNGASAANDVVIKGYHDIFAPR